MRKQIKYSLIAAGALLLGPLMVLAQWTSAPPSPPASNTSAPINVGSLLQTKSGNLTVSGMTVDSLISNGTALIGGNVGLPASGYLNFGATLGTSGYGLHDAAGTLQYKNSGGAWANLGGGGASQWTTSGSNIYYNVSGGNVGINNAGPVYKLDVGTIGGSQSATAGAGGLIRNASPADSSPYTQPRIVVYGGTGVDLTNWGYLGYGSDANMRIVYGRTGANRQLQIGQTSAMDGTGAFTPSLTVDGTAGNVGISTASPNALLSLGSAINTIKVAAYDSGGVLYGMGVNSGKLTFGANLSSANGTPQMVLDTSGQLGIGQTTPTARLDVNGGANISGGVNIGSGGPGIGLLVQNGNVGLGENTTPAARLDINEAQGGLGWSGNLKALRVLSPDNSYTMDLSTYIVAGGNVGYAFVPSSSGFGANVNALNITSQGYVGLGTSNPGYKLDVLGDINVSGCVRVNGICLTSGGGGSGTITGVTAGSNLTGGGTTGTVTVGLNSTVAISGNMTAAAFYYSSDRNLKKNIEPLDDSLDKILQLQGVSFDWKSTDQASVGLIAQDVEKVYPELVTTDPKTGLKAVEYGNLVAPLIEAVKTQQQEIDELKAEVDALEAAK